MKKFKKPASLILALCLVFALAVSACADNNITASGGSGTTPVSLSSTTDGSSGGDPAGTAMNVTVPTSLPMTMSQDGDVLTADNCRITNNSYGAVRVASVSISAAEGWNLTAFGDKASLAGEKVDSNKLGFAMRRRSGRNRFRRGHSEPHHRTHRGLLHDRRGRQLPQQRRRGL